MQICNYLYFKSLHVKEHITTQILHFAVSDHKTVQNQEEGTKIFQTPTQKRHIAKNSKTLNVRHLQESAIFHYFIQILKI
ncbi:hypothetical protein BC643_0387 [Mangrovibacterium diazotrophicum]|uniref:Uncharacterized protein n=1 Tax=Mangrovibacterium diazotrophicum TaxID=1261403 RepID=A0A419W3I9_9BACT|nr:hypothetical protein BC643_0387 [Mangrovibacterium diazotrophicum]